MVVPLLNHLNRTFLLIYWWLQTFQTYGGAGVLKGISRWRHADILGILPLIIAYQILGRYLPGRIEIQACSVSCSELSIMFGKEMAVTE